ncbi:HlyD family efflux transporter periplasmic adaptor subunit [Planctomyces sp. SH-PL62]|uniref:HlyD family efflux transporter periplasmic adaptor subunit n=1 Tax=Planctomyces sp. SH-PL62 TaxID=1636152 RepID=UPI0009ECEB38|nr:HlyD family efflux transporter periplasmic adaptor subunit [Planctomyces sp. SH-PL62]
MRRMLVRTLIVAALVAVGTAAWYAYQAQLRKKLPAGIVSGNGRVESVQVDVSAKYPGRVVRIFAEEGDLVRKGQVLAQMDTDELEAKLASGKAKIAEAQENENQIKAEIVEREAIVRYQNQEFARNRELFSRRVVSREEMEKSQTKRDISVAAVDSVKAKLQVNMRTIEAATADLQDVRAKLADSTLLSPVNGRVLYRLAQEREVLGAGGKVLTLVNLDDVYMEIFLPSDEAARIEIGAEARIRLDAYPDYSARANVTFVSPEAQFTPKQVETRTERDKLMFRVKLKVPEELILPYIEKIKTGVRGVGYVKLDPATPWPANLDRRFPQVVADEAAKAKTAPEPAPKPKTEPTPVEPPKPVDAPKEGGPEAKPSAPEPAPASAPAPTSEPKPSI